MNIGRHRRSLLPHNTVYEQYLLLFDTLIWFYSIGAAASDLRRNERHVVAGFLDLD